MTNLYSMVSFSDYNKLKHYEFITELFLEAFPDYNMHEIERCLNLTEEGILSCTIINYEGNPAGFMFFRKYDKFSYCEYIAVSGKYRGKSIAPSLINHVCGEGEQWIFEIETGCGGAVCEARVRMMEKTGFVHNRYPYHMPREEEINSSARFELWSRFPLSQERFNEVVRTLRSDKYF